MDFLSLARDIDLLEKNPENEEIIMYLSRIEEIGENSLFISPPFIRECYWQPLQAEIGKIINARVMAERGAYFFDTELLSIRSDGTELWEIALPMNVRKMQKREYVRLNMILDVQLEFIDSDKKKVTAFTKDISAGGIQLVMEEVPLDGSGVRLRIPLTKELIIYCQGEIIRTIVPESSRDRFITAIKFVDITSEEQEQITKYIFRKEVERRKKERQLFGKSLR